MKEAMRVWRRAAVGPALLAAALLGGAARAQAGALPAVLDGDPALVASIGDDLVRRGIATSAPPDAEAVRVRLARQDQGIVVDLSDPQGRTAERAVASADTAAALIESWSRREIADPLLTPRRPPEPPPVIRAEPPPPPTAAPSGWRPQFRLDGRTADDPDAGWWLGASAGACVRLGPVCLGGEGRLARRIDRGAPRDDLGAPLPDGDWEAMATAELPIALGRPQLVLGLGVGIGQRAYQYERQVGPRLAWHTDLLLPLWSQLALDLGVDAVWGRVGYERAALPGNHVDSQLQFGLGVRWGLP
jgi:hypothetical protein